MESGRTGKNTCHQVEKNGVNRLCPYPWRDVDSGKQSLILNPDFLKSEFTERQKSPSLKLGPRHSEVLGETPTFYRFQQRISLYFYRSFLVPTVRDGGTQELRIYVGKGNQDPWKNV